jgi:hypothetical protein
MENSGATLNGGVGVICQAGKIGRQNGRRYLDQNRASLASKSEWILPR